MTALTIIAAIYALCSAAVFLLAWTAPEGFETDERGFEYGRPE